MHLPQFGKQWTRTLLAASALASVFATCTPPAPPRTATTAPAQPGDIANAMTLADFEKPDDAVRWLPLTATPATDAVPASQPATTSTPAPAIRRSSLRPQAGLWAMSATVDQPGEIRRTFTAPINLASFNLLSAHVAHAMPPARNGAATAALVLTDASDKRYEGDAFPVKEPWQAITLDLNAARGTGFDTEHVASAGILFRPAASAHAPATQPEAPLTVLTDTWVARRHSELFTGEPRGDKALYVSGRGSDIVVQSGNRFTLTLSDHGARYADGIAADPVPWLEVASESAGEALPPGGIMLLDSDAFQSLADFRSTGPDDSRGKDAPGVHKGWQLPTASWPANINRELTQIHWQVV